MSSTSLGRRSRRLPAALPQGAASLPAVPGLAAKPGRQTRAAMAADAAVGVRIRALRRAAGQTQTRLASRVGVTNARMHRYEAGISRVAASRLVAIAPALDVPVEDLLHEGATAGQTVMPHREAFASLARAFAVGDRRHRAALVSLARTMAGEAGDLPGAGCA